MSPTQPKYVLITPARNEEEFIELTIRSMIAQTVRPLRWIIVSDGSTDRTDAIVAKYAADHAWIELLRMSEREERHFGGKALCFQAGYDRMKDLKYDIIGNLDADLSFDNDVFALLMNKFAGNPKLGVAGVPFAEGNGTYNFRFSSVEHVSGACQLFRRECFEVIGGYCPMKGGGLDVLAVLTARMKGWETRTFPEKFCFHHRSMGSAKHNAATISFRLGQKDYRLGRHPLWQLFRGLYQMTRPPLFIGGVMLLSGYLWNALRREPRNLPKEVINFQRWEQMRRLRQFITRGIWFRKSPEAVSSGKLRRPTAAKVG